MNINLSSENFTRNGSLAAEVVNVAKAAIIFLEVQFDSAKVDSVTIKRIISDQQGVISVDDIEVSVHSHS